MPSGKQRSSANAPDSFSVSVNERILRECHDLYANEERGKNLSCARDSIGHVTVTGASPRRQFSEILFVVWLSSLYRVLTLQGS